MKKNMVYSTHRMCASTPTHAAARGGRVVQAVIALALCIPFFLASCNKKDAVSSHTAGTNVAMRQSDDSALEVRIQSFYATMKNLHSTAGASDALISKDSTEFLIEAAYNYEVARNNYDKDNQNGEFSFIVASNADGSLTETNVSKSMYRIKDSLLAATPPMPNGAPQLSLFDLKVAHGEGITADTFVIDYSFTGSERVIVKHPPNDPTLIYGDSTYAYAALNQPCGYTPIWVYPNYAGLGSYGNPYYRGTGTINFPTNSLVANTMNCSNYGAAAVLRNMGISNYCYNTGQSSMLSVLMVNIQSQSELPTANTVIHDYAARGITDYQKADQYWVSSLDDGTGNPIVTGTHFYVQWLNVPMMNHYLGYISNKIVTHIPLGQTFKDFQIFRYQNTGISANIGIRYRYYYYYGQQSKISLPPNPKTGGTDTGYLQLSDF